MDIEVVTKKAISGNQRAVTNLVEWFSKGDTDIMSTLVMVAKQGNLKALAAIEECANNGDIDAIVAMGEIYSS